MDKILITDLSGIERLEDASNLVRKDISQPFEHGTIEATEYRFPESDQIVHRSVHVIFETWPAVVTEQGQM
jgi:hypothetical protein